MLVLTRKKGERIVINKDIVITILGTIRGETRIGIDAPKEVDVHREEVFIRIQEGVPRAAK